MMPSAHLVRIWQLPICQSCYSEVKLKTPSRAYQKRRDSFTAKALTTKFSDSSALDDLVDQAQQLSKRTMKATYLVLALSGLLICFTTAVAGRRELKQAYPTCGESVLPPNKAD